MSTLFIFSRPIPLSLTPMSFEGLKTCVNIGPVKKALKPPQFNIDLTKLLRYKSFRSLKIGLFLTDNRAKFTYLLHVHNHIEIL